MRQRTDQLELDRRWPSASSARPRGSNPRIRHRSREGIAERFPCHVTTKVREEMPSLRSVRLVKEIEPSVAQCCDRVDFRLVHYSLQGDHAHLIVEATDRHALGRGMKALGARLARAVNRVFRPRGPVLADRYHVRVLRTPREVRNALAYVLLNARGHARKAFRAILLDPASSGRWFDGWKRGDSNRSLSDAPSVAQPRSWLLAVGWRTRGLIDPDEIPGRRFQL